MMSFSKTLVLSALLVSAAGVQAEPAWEPALKTLQDYQPVQPRQKPDPVKQQAAMHAYAELLAAIESRGQGRKTAAETTSLRQRLGELLDKRGEIIAGGKNRIDANVDPLKMLLYRQQSWQAQQTPVAEIKAAKSADWFPGAIPATAPRLSREFEIDAAISGWQSLGLYAAPGDRVTITIPETAVKAGLALRIGCHKDILGPQLEALGADGKPAKGKDKEKLDLRNLKPEIAIADNRRLVRWPVATRTFELTAPRTETAYALGGLLYVVVPRNAPAGKIKITIDGAVEAPYFVLGQTTNADWAKRRLAPAPYAELATPDLVLTVPSATIRDLQDAEGLMRWWKQAMKLEDKLSARPRTSPERIVDDIQISAGGGHSGYPIMAGNWAKGMVNLAGLQEKGHWGCLHELGHNENARNNFLSLPNSGEVVCNVFGCYVINTLDKVPIPEIRAKSWQSAEKLLADGQGNVWERADLFEKLMFYLRIADAFGWDPFLKIAAAEKAKPADGKPEDRLLVGLSRATGRNLTTYFLAWGWNPSEPARQAIAPLPDWKPPFKK